MNTHSDAMTSVHALLGGCGSRWARRYDIGASSQAVVVPTTNGRPGWGQRALQLGDASLQEALLGRRARELERTLVRRARLVVTTEAAQELRPRRVQVLVVVELQRLDDSQSLLGRASLRDCDCAVELDHR